jgi:hypothetical protein
MNAAADTREIHHNSSRYRLAKVESLLNIRLREPAAVSSVFLALTALGIDDSHSDDAAFRSGAHVQMPAEVDAPRNLVLNEGSEAEILDAALAPNADATLINAIRRPCVAAYVLGCLDPGHTIVRTVESASHDHAHHRRRGDDGGVVRSAHLGQLLAADPLVNLGAAAA